MNGVVARIKSWLGGRAHQTVTVPEGSQITVAMPNNTNVVPVSCPSANGSSILVLTSRARNRVVWLYNAGSNSIDLVNSSGTTTAGQMDLGVADVTLGATDGIYLYQRADGAWVRAAPVANN